MNAPIGTKDRPWRARISAINGESSADILRGNVVCLDSSNLGQVKLPSGSGGATVATPLFAGIAVTDAKPGDPVGIVCGGYVAEAMFVVRTRAAGTDTWASVPARAIGDLLTIDTTNNALAYSAPGAASLGLPAAVLLESMASVASAPSSFGGTALAQITKVKVWVRALG